MAGGDKDNTPNIPDNVTTNGMWHPNLIITTVINTNPDLGPMGEYTHVYN